MTVYEGRLITIELPDSAEQMTTQRTMLALEQWPHLDRAWGCENCRLLFAQPDNHRCPHCASEAVFDAAKLLNAERPSTAEVVGTAMEIISKIDEAISHE